MKIGIDLRLTSKDTLYTNFIIKLVEYLINTDKQNTYVLYSNNNLEIDFEVNTELKVVNEKPGSFTEQFSLNSKFKQEDFSLMIFFNHEIPIFYKKNFIIFIPNLKELFFTTKTFFQKRKYNIQMNIALKNCKKVICLDKNTITDLNEKLNIKETNIELLVPFFLIDDKLKRNETKLKTDVKLRYNLKSDYLIYDGSNGANANLTKLFKALIALKNKKIDINLLMLSDDTVADIDLREEVIDYNIQDRVFFIGKVKSVEEESYYKQSLGVIFPSIYESFPFRLSRAIKFGVPIISSNIPTVTNLLGDKIITFNPLSATNLINKLTKFLSSKKEKIDYSKIKKEYSIKNTGEQFKKIIYENIYDE